VPTQTKKQVIRKNNLFFCFIRYKNKFKLCELIYLVYK
jgi:hypothetical protein